MNLRTEWKREKGGRMKFSTKSRYALRLMLDLTGADADERVSLKDVAARQEISVKYLEQIVPQLVRAGLVKSSRGARGGYKLAKDAGCCTPGDVVRAIEGNIAVVACLGECPNTCGRAAGCRALAFWEGLNNAVAGYLDGMTLREMISSAPTEFSSAPRQRCRGSR